MKLPHVSLVLLICSMLSRCGSNPSSDLESVRSNTTPVLVVMGGNNSCDSNLSPRSMGLFDPFEKVLEKLNSQNGEEVPFLVSCYNSGASKLYYITSDSDGQVKEGLQPDLTDDLSRLVETAANPGLMIAGHSYGGWLALQTAISLKDKAKLSALFSIDAISRVECTFASPMNCTSAPKDISRSQYAAIGASTTHWLNFYQTDTFYLHSSAIAGATHNIRVSAPHVGIDSDETVWTNINQVVDLEQALLGNYPNEGS
jgi:hypothetical protein